MSSVRAIPATMRAAPARARRPRCSFRKIIAISHAKTGSSDRMTAVCVGGRCFCAQLWMVKAAAGGEDAGDEQRDDQARREGGRVGARQTAK